MRAAFGGGCCEVEGAGEGCAPKEFGSFAKVGPPAVPEASGVICVVGRAGVGETELVGRRFAACAGAEEEEEGMRSENGSSVVEVA